MDESVPFLQFYIEIKPAALKEKKKIIPHIDETEWWESPYLIIKGFLMGSADIVPGVSGGTMALITGIYDRLIYAIKSLDRDFIKNIFRFKIIDAVNVIHWKFLMLLFTGMVGAVAFFTKVVPLQIYMFTHPEIIYGLFFGLIVGSIFLLVVEIAPDNRGWKNALPIIAGALFGFWIVTLVPTATPTTAWYVFLSGAIAISAMILPGISGSYILLILGKYDYILTQLGNLGTPETLTSVINLTPFFFGTLVGIILFSRVLSWLLKNYHATTLLVLVGFLVGSLYVIWPYQERDYAVIVTSSQVMHYTDPEVQRIMAREEVPDLPEYHRIAKVINPDAPTNEQRVEIETVSRKVLSSKPIIPEKEQDDVNVRGGLFGMAGGLMMIWVISYLRQN
ncbi:hypothetical protein BH23BAC3_BH23BAC3_26670 [soil metagenome]